MDLKLSVGFFVIVGFAICKIASYPNAIPLGKKFHPKFYSEFQHFLGLIYRQDEVDAKDGAYMAIIRHNRNNRTVLFMLNEELGRIMHDPKNTLKTIKLSKQLKASRNRSKFS